MSRTRHRPSARFLDRYDRVLFDIDGTTLMDQVVLPGAAEFVQEVRSRRKTVCFGTNSSSVQGFEVAERLTAAGITAELSECLTAVEALAGLIESALPNTAIPTLAPKEVTDVLTLLSVDCRPIGELQGQDGPLSHLIVAGLCSRVNPEALETASQLISADTTLFVTNLDVGMVTARGTLAGPAATVNQIGQRCGYTPKAIVAGKPSLNFVRSLEALVPCRGRTLVIGDMLRSDVALANLAGWDSLLVLSGATTRSDIEDCPAAWQPTMVVSDLTELLGLCENTQ